MSDTIYYSKDYDIELHDKMVLQNLDLDPDLKVVEDRIQAIKNKLDGPCSYVEHMTLMKHLTLEEENLSHVQNGSKRKEYITKTRDVLNEYRKHRKDIHIISISNPEQNKEDMKLLSIIEKYLIIADKYYLIPVKRIVKTDEGVVCPGCETILNRPETDEEGKIKCKHCFAEIHPINVTKRKKIKEKSSVSNQSETNTLENSLKALRRLQGKQTDEIPVELLERIDKWYIAKGEPSAEEIRSMEHDSGGKKGGTSFSDLSKTLKKMKTSGYYNDVHLIGKLLWDWKLPNLSHIEEKFIDIFNKTQRVSSSIPAEEKERSSSLGTHFRNWKQLLILSYHGFIDPVPRSEFKIVESSKSLLIQETLWKRMCEECGDPDIIYFKNDQYER
jgi:DNA-directed RNA polymerase subunit M/transcription elongation factor TFIIS